MLDRMVAFDLDKRTITWRYDTEGEIVGMLRGEPRMGHPPPPPAGQPPTLHWTGKMIDQAYNSGLSRAERIVHDAARAILRTQHYDSSPATEALFGAADAIARVVEERTVEVEKVCLGMAREHHYPSYDPHNCSRCGAKRDFVGPRGPRQAIMGENLSAPVQHTGGVTPPPVEGLGEAASRMPGGVLGLDLSGLQTGLSVQPMIDAIREEHTATGSSTIAKLGDLLARLDNASAASAFVHGDTRALARLAGEAAAAIRELVNVRRAAGF